MYSAASAVLLNECLKGTISISIAFYNTLLATPGSGYAPLSLEDRSDEEKAERPKRWDELMTASRIRKAGAKLRKEVFRCVGSSASPRKRDAGAAANASVSSPAPTAGSSRFQLASTSSKTT